MTTVIIVIHLLLAIAMVGLILMQRSEGGALGMGGGGGGGGMGGFMTGRATANLLTRATAILAVLFMSTSLMLAILAKGTNKPSSILDQPAGAPATEQPLQPAEPKGPSVPLAN